MRVHSFRLLMLIAALALTACANVPGNDSDYAVAGPKKVAPAAATGKGIRMAGGYYEGAMQNGVPEGQGIFRYDDGRRYEGSFSGGRFNGPGRMSYPDGRKVDATFRNDYEDTGKLSYIDGRVFEGQMQKGVPHGKGTLSLKDGSSVTGAFQNGRVEGRALQSRADGSTYFGPFANGVPQGTGICGGASGSSICSRNGNADTTAQTMRQLAEQRAAKSLEDVAKAARDALEKEAAERRRPAESERDALQTQRNKHASPENDPECSCAIYKGCITVGNSNDRTPPEVYRLQRERRVLMCKQKYAGWLQIKDDPDFGKRMADLDRRMQDLNQKLNQEAQQRRQRQQEIDARLAKQKADAAEMARLAQAERAKEEALRQKKLEEARQRCRDSKIRQANPCHCATVLNEPLPSKKGSVCEA